VTSTVELNPYDSLVQYYESLLGPPDVHVTQVMDALEWIVDHHELERVDDLVEAMLTANCDWGTNHDTQSMDGSVYLVLMIAAYILEAPGLHEADTLGIAARVFDNGILGELTSTLQESMRRRGITSVYDIIGPGSRSRLLFSGD